MRDANNLVLRKIRSISLFSSILGGISIVSLLSDGFSIGWTSPFLSILKIYLFITDNISRVLVPILEPVFGFIAENIFLGFSYGDRWIDIFFLMFIYLGSRVKAYFAGGKYVRAGVMSLISSLICLICSVLASALPLVNGADVLLPTTIPLIGFLLYDLVYAVVGSTLDRGRKPWLNEFVRHLWFSVPMLVMCFCLVILFTIVFESSQNLTPYQNFIIIFAGYYVFISGYWAFKAFLHSVNRKNLSMGESVSERFWRSSATYVSLNVLLVVVTGLSMLVGNAGLKALGVASTKLLTG